MERVRELGLDELVGDWVEAGAPVLGICLGLQLLFESSTELGGAEGLGPARGIGRPARGRRLKVPHIGWEPVTGRSPSPLTEGIGEATPFYFVHSFAPRPASDGDVLGTAATASASPARSQRPPPTASSSIPRSRARAGLRLLGNFAALSQRAASERLILYPAIDIRGGGRCAWSRATTTARRPTTTIRWSRPGAGSTGGARAARRRPRRRAGRASRSTSSTSARSSPRSGSRSSRRRPARPQDGRGGAPPGAERVVLGTAALPDPALVAALVGRPRRSASSSRSTPAAGKVAARGLDEQSERQHDRCDRRLSARGVRRFVFTPVEVDGHARGPDARRTARGRRGAATRRRLIYSGGIGSLDHLRAWRRSGSRTSRA